MVYTVLKIEEDLDFGCEERIDSDPPKALVTLEDRLGEKKTIRVPDQLLDER